MKGKILPHSSNAVICDTSNFSNWTPSLSDNRPSVVCTKLVPIELFHIQMFTILAGVDVANNFGAKETYPCISMKISHFLYVYSEQDEKYLVIFYTSLIDCTAKKSDICEVCLGNKRPANSQSYFLLCNFGFCF